MQQSKNQNQSQQNSANPEQPLHQSESSESRRAALPGAASTDMGQLFEPFSRLSGTAKCREGDFYEIAHDIANGVSTILNMVVTSTIDDNIRTAGGDTTPLLGAQARENLLLFSMAASQLLRDKAAGGIDFLNSQAAKSIAPQRSL